MTYYHYKDGKLIGTSEEEPNIRNDRGQPETASNQSNGDIVGAYLANRERFYPALTASNPYQQAPGCLISGHQDNAMLSAKRASPNYLFNGSYESQKTFKGPPYPDHSSTSGYVGIAALSGLKHPYPDPEHIRHFHTLHSILPYIQPERKLNTLNGPTLDIIEQDTSIILAYAVPKKLLILFLGRKIVNKFLKTLERKGNTHWSGPPVLQQLSLPRRKASKCAIRILIAWMMRACQPHGIGNMRHISIPVNTFAACSLAQTMELLGLHKDALRVDAFIAQNHFVRPIFAVELQALWNCLGEGSKYVYGAVRAVGTRVAAYEAGAVKMLPGAEEMFALLEREPKLRERVRVQEKNEMYRPEFGVEWMRKINGDVPVQRQKTNGDGGAGEEDGVVGSDDVQNANVDARTGGQETERPTHPEPTEKRRVAVLRIVPGPSAAPAEEVLSKEEAKL